jgi:predicted DsbA family dithiol-disulfide isomerase
LKRKFPEKASAEHGGYLESFAGRFGVGGLKRPSRLPNTRRALAIAEYARDEGKIDLFRSMVMDARWKEDRDIGDNAVLVDLARSAGLNPDRAMAAADDPLYLARVGAMRVEYKGVGVGGIPTFVFPGVSPVEGCRPYEEVADAAVRSGTRRK